MLIENAEDRALPRFNFNSANKISMGIATTLMPGYGREAYFGRLAYTLGLQHQMYMLTPYEEVVLPPAMYSASMG